MKKIALVDMQLPTAQKAFVYRLAKEPIGLLELGAYVREKSKIDVMYYIIDSQNYDVSNIIKTKPDFVGFSTYSYNYPYARKLASDIKAADPNIQIAFGGPHAGNIPYEVLKESKTFVDAVIKKEGELGLVSFLNGQRGVIEAPPVQLDTIPYADRLESLLENSNFRILQNEKFKAAVVVTTRGCNRSCDFCVDRLSGHRTKTSNQVIGEIKHLTTNYGVQIVIFEDPLINGNLSYLESICDGITYEQKNGLLGRFYATSMIDFNLGNDPRRILEKLSTAGFIQLHWGIEDPRQEYRKGFNKKVKLQSEILRISRECGISNRGLLMLPTNFATSSPIDDIRSYTDALLELPLDEVKMNITTPYPGTPFYNSLLQARKIKDFDWSKYDTNYLVFDANPWTQEIVDWGREYITQKFNQSREINGKTNHV